MTFYMISDGLIQQTGGEKGLLFDRERFMEYKGDEDQLDDVTALGFAVPAIRKDEPETQGGDFKRSFFGSDGTRPP